MQSGTIERNAARCTVHCGKSTVLCVWLLDIRGWLLFLRHRFGTVTNYSLHTVCWCGVGADQTSTTDSNIALGYNSEAFVFVVWKCQGACVVMFADSLLCVLLCCWPWGRQLCVVAVGRGCTLQSFAACLAVEAQSDERASAEAAV